MDCRVEGPEYKAGFLSGPRLSISPSGVCGGVQPQKKKNHQSCESKKVCYYSSTQIYIYSVSRYF